MKSCWNCNKELAANATSCPHCGVPTSKEAIRQMATVGPGGAGVKQIVIGATVADRYEIRRELGRGGMGIVYLAYDKTMAREVALKVIPQELCLDPRAVADLKRETGIALNLTHEHIVRLYNLDLWEGQAFVTMEYVSGGTLAHLLAKKERYTLPEILPLLQQMAAALDYSHNANPAVIHRDLKPLNVLLTEDGRIKIADFGLARVLRDSASRVSGHESAGTLAYMAPEQVRGKGIGRQADLYAFAAITYELLCGHPPFYTGDLRWQILHEEVEPIEVVTEHINMVLLLALDKEGNNRPASAAEFVKLLSGAETATREKLGKQSQPKQPKEAPTAKEPGTPSRPPKRIFAAITALLLVALAASGWIFQGSAEKSQVEIQQSQPVNLAATPTPPTKREKPPTSGSISITSDPDGAQVIIDGKKAGLTPLLTMQIEKGSYQIEVTKAAYKTWARKVTITANSTEEIKASLEKSSKDAASGKPGGQEPAPSKPPPTYTDPITGMEFVYVPGGCFQMGSPAGEKDRDTNEGPVHEVCVDGMYLGKYEVTIGQWRAFSKATGHKTDAEKDSKGCVALKDNEWDWQKGYYWDNVGFPQTDRQPVACVSHNDVVEYISWLKKQSNRTYRLPTEAEWEYAARGGTSTMRYWGDNEADACRYANVADKSGNWDKPFPCNDGYGMSTSPVGNYQANKFGLFDMLGNVWEWTGDWYDEKYYQNSPRNNPAGPSVGDHRVFRGGSWINYPGFVRSAVRERNSPGNRGDILGFRLLLQASAPGR